MRLGVAQINPTVGDLAGNAELILTALREADDRDCTLTLFPEMALTGYPPEDLLFKSEFVKANRHALKEIVPLVKKSIAVVGYIDERKGKLYNAAAIIHNGKVRDVYHKQCLPNYGVYDEKRYFHPGTKAGILNLNGFRLGITICEDIWNPPNKLADLKKKKPHLVLNMSASPFHAGKVNDRIQVVKKTAQYVGAPVVYCNMVGGQDELVFDGGSIILNKKGATVHQAPQFQTGLFTADIERAKNNITIHPNEKKEPLLSDIEEIQQALSLGLKDYVNKNNFEKVTLGISGGIDSALVAALATKALGAKRVVGVTMPSQFNLSETQQDAKKLAKNLGIKLIEIPIQPLFESYNENLKNIFGNRPPDLTEENLQARIRGNLMMALSNKFGWLVLTTGNKSETSTGYTTLYGDMAGGFAVLKDVLKTTVFKLARHMNAGSANELIPPTIITRPPTAELRPNQKDEDSLGAYTKLDPIIIGYVENNLSLDRLNTLAGGDMSYVKRIVSLIDQNEYKRRQSPPGIKITPRAFGRDHRMPITNRFKSN